MYLREIRIGLSRCLWKDPIKSTFPQTAHHVREIFAAILPHKYYLDGSSLFQITFGSKENKPKYYSLLGSSEYFVEDFDFTSYYNSPPSHQQEIILQTIKNVFVLIAEQNNSDIETLKKVVQQIRDVDFYLKTKIQKLCKKHPESKLRININRILSIEDGESWTMEVYKGKESIHDEYITIKPSYIDQRGVFFKSELQDSIFSIFDTLGTKTLAFDLNNLQRIPFKILRGVKR
jgi:hypothetical protein